jgi:carbamoyl-phosphate synthase large subunit
MKSTGEVMGVGATFGAAFHKAQLAANVRLPRGGMVFMRVKRADQARAVALARQLHAAGFTLCASHVTATVIAAADVPVATVDDAETLDMMNAREIALAVLTVDEKRSAIHASRALRVAALASGVPFYTTIAGAEAALEGIRHIDDHDLCSLRALHDMVAERPSASGRVAPTEADRAAAAARIPERRRHERKPATGTAPLKVFIRQPFTESDLRQQRMISDVMHVIDSANGAPYAFDYLTGTQAESANTFKQSFEREQNMLFTPRNFRDHRLGLLDQADVMINIRVGMSESSAFELSYHIFKGRCTPVLFLVWKGAPIKTTLIRELEDLVDVTYIEFDEVEDLRAGIHQFFSSQRFDGARRAT